MNLVILILKVFNIIAVDVRFQQNTLFHVDDFSKMKHDA